MYQNKRYVTKETSRSTSKALDSLSNVPKVKYKENKSTKNRRSPEAIEVRLDMSHMRPAKSHQKRVASYPVPKKRKVAYRNIKGALLMIISMYNMYNKNKNSKNWQSFDCTIITVFILYTQHKISG